MASKKVVTPIVPVVTSNKKPATTPERKAEIIAARQAGESINAIAKRFGMPASTVWVIANGYKPANKGTGRVSVGKHSPAYVQAVANAKVMRDSAIAQANATYEQDVNAAAALDSAWKAEQEKLAAEKQAIADKIAAEKLVVKNQKAECKNRLASLKAEFAALNSK